MNKTTKNPARQPILLVYAGFPSHFGDSVSATVVMEFRYRRDDCNQLQTYWLVDYEESGNAYDGLKCQYRVNGDSRRPHSDEFNGSLYPLRYDEVHDLHERKLSQMLKTLKQINRKLESIESKEGPTGQLSEYVRRVAKVVKAKEIALYRFTYSIEEGMGKIEDLIRETRRRCLEMSGNSDEALDLEQRVQEWCEENGYSEPSKVDEAWWAFPPNGVMQVCIDSHLSII